MSLIISGAVSVKKYYNMRYAWVPMDAFVRFITEEHLKEIAARAKMEKTQKAEKPV